MAVDSPAYDYEARTASAVPPDDLGDPGKAAWTAALECSWIGTAMDLLLVREYCDLVDERVDLLRRIKARGRTAKGSKGQRVTAPAIAQLRGVERALRRIESVLGLGPQNRGRVGAAVQPPSVPREPEDRVAILRAISGGGA